MRKENKKKKTLSKVKKFNINVENCSSIWPEFPIFEILEVVTLSVIITEQYFTEFSADGYGKMA